LDSLKSVTCRMLLLTDLKTGITQNLTEKPVYCFSSEITDEPDRFILKLGTLGQNEKEFSDAPEIYSYGKKVYVSGIAPGTLVQVIDVNGRLIEEHHTGYSEIFSCNLNMPAGIYIVRVAGKKSVKSVKIVLV